MTRFWSVGIGAVASLTLAGIFGSQALEWSSSPTSHTDARQYGRQITRLEVGTETGRVTLQRSTTDTLTVHRTVRESLRSAAARATVEGHTLTLAGGCPDVLSGRCSVSYVIDVPDGVTVEAHSDSGSVSASDLHGRTSLSVSSGDAEATGIRGNLTAESSSGDVDVSDVDADVVQLRTGSGDVHGDFISSPQVTATTGSGDVELTLTRAPDLVDATTGSGDATIRLPRGPEYDIGVTGGSSRPDYGGVARSNNSPHQIDVEVGSGQPTFRYTD